MNHYDIFPRVFPENRTVRITIRPLGRHKAFQSGKTYTIRVIPMLYRDKIAPDWEHDFVKIPVVPDDKGFLCFEHSFPEEQEHLLELFNDEHNFNDEHKIETFQVYSLHHDLACRYPFLGDLHVHSCYSDGVEAPEIVAADYRKRGYDFVALTDHHNYAGSLAAIRAYRNTQIDLNIVPGEEVHFPDNEVHIVNFGGLRSVNALVRDCVDYVSRKGTDTVNASPEEWCITPGQPIPKTMEDDEFRSLIKGLVKKAGFNDERDAYCYCACEWLCDRIREADGLCIFAHPYWRCSTYHVDENMTRLLLDSGMFDAFELFGGERYLEQNEFQLFAYQEARARGKKIPVVGSSDVHGVYNNINSDVAATIVFADKNERSSLITAVRQGYSAAVDGISKEIRLGGELRFVRYARYLLETYFPELSALCFEEGRLMKAYVCGTEPDALDKLNALHGRTDALRRKLFLIEN